MLYSIERVLTMVGGAQCAYSYDALQHTYYATCVNQDMPINLYRSLLRVQPMPIDDGFTLSLRYNGHPGHLTDGRDSYQAERRIRKLLSIGGTHNGVPRSIKNGVGTLFRI